MRLTYKYMCRKMSIKSKHISKTLFSNNNMRPTYLCYLEIYIIVIRSHALSCFNLSVLELIPALDFLIKCIHTLIREAFRPLLHLTKIM